MTKTTNVTEAKSVDDWLDSIDINTIEMRDGAYLRAIAAAREALNEAERGLVQAVEDARNAGDSWGAIGMVLGTSRQAAHRKFSQRAS